jgi:hypothetical protein
MADETIEKLEVIAKLDDLIQECIGYLGGIGDDHERRHAFKRDTTLG